MRWLGAIFVLGVLARVGGQLVLGAYPEPDVFEYEEIASNLLGGHGYTYASPDGGVYVASQSSPLYIVLTAGVYLITDHNQTAMLLLQAILGGATAALVAWLCMRVFSRVNGITAGTLVAVDPGLVAYAAQLHSLTVDALANVALLAASAGLPVRPSGRRLGSVGALFGLAALTRATALVLLPVHLLWLRRYRGVRLVSAGAIGMLVLAAVVYAPWPLRNSILLGQLTLGSSETTEWLWRGNNENANGASLTSDDQRMLDRAPAEFQAEVAAADEAQRVGLYRDAALGFIRSEPGRALWLYVEKLVGFWWGSEVTGLLYPQLWLVGYRVWYIAILIPAFWGTWRAWYEPRQRPVVALVLVTLLVVSLTQAVFYVEGRHRLAVEPLVLILSGAGLVQLGRVVRIRAGQARGSDSLVPSGQLVQTGRVQRAAMGGDHDS